MKNKTRPASLRGLCVGLCALCVVFATTGCTSLVTQLEKFDQLGIKEAHIPGRVTNTDYTREVNDGVITTTLEHSNPWLIKPAKIVRERKQ